MQASWAPAAAGSGPAAGPAPQCSANRPAPKRWASDSGVSCRTRGRPFHQRSVSGLHTAGVAVLTEVERVTPQEVGTRALHAGDAPLLQIGSQAAKLSGVEINGVRT